ncbi:hypothetical protein D3C81_1833910 [compost metagenome]
MAVHDAARTREGADQLARQRHVPHTQSGKQRLAEGAQIQGPFKLVHALHAGRGHAVVVEFAVVVVFDDPPAVVMGPARQHQPTFQRQGGACWILMRRRHVNAVGAALILAQQVHADALRVHVDRHDSGLRGFERLAGAEVTGVLHQDGAVRVH